MWQSVIHLLSGIMVGVFVAALVGGLLLFRQCSRFTQRNDEPAACVEKEFLSECSSAGYLFSDSKTSDGRRKRWYYKKGIGPVLVCKQLRDGSFQCYLTTIVVDPETNTMKIECRTKMATVEHVSASDYPEEETFLAFKRKMPEVKNISYAG